MMKRKAVLIVAVFIVLFTAACIKETYNMTKLSDKISLSPTLALAAVQGNIAFSDMVKSNDTVVFDQNKQVRIVYKKDNVLELKLTDLYDFSNMVSLSNSYTMGPLNLGNFQASTTFTLGQITQFFTNTALKNAFTALNDGATHPFPAFPSTDLGERTYSGITNFETATFKSGFLDISITNNLTAPLGTINIALYNTTGHTAIGTSVTIPASNPGETKSASIDLTDKTISNSIIAAIILSGSAGNATPVLINLNTSGVSFAIRGRDLIVKSGKVLLPAQDVTSYQTVDTIDFDPGTGIELDEFKIATGNLSYHIQSTTTLTASLTVAMPSSIRNNIPISETINVGPGSNFNGTISFANSYFDMGTDIKKPYNRVPVNYTINVSSGTSLVNFNETDKVQVDLSLQNPVFDYLKGYFGQQVETIAPNIMDLNIQDVLKNLTGTLLISSPTIKVNYSNSFAVPVSLTFNATGKRNTQTVNLGLAPVTLNIPAAPNVRDATGTITIDKTNSSLPALISMPPGEIDFSGSASMNPAGNDGLRNNYVFGTSRFVAGVEVDVPLEFRFNNLQFSDTIDNFLKDSGNSNDNPISPENFKMMRIDLKVMNGFPLGVSVKMKLYDPVTQTVKSTIDATDLLKPASVDNTGKVTTATESSTSLEFTRDFFSSISKADKIIMQFTLNTTGSGASDVKIYSNYTIDFSAALVVKPEIKLN